MLGYFTALYRFWRGSIRYKLIPEVFTGLRSLWCEFYPLTFDREGLNQQNTQRSTNIKNVDEDWDLATLDGESKFCPAVYNTNNLPLELEVPYYNIQAMLPTKQGLIAYSNTSITSNIYFQSVGGILKVYAHRGQGTFADGDKWASESDYIKGWIAAGDDYALSTPLGVPTTYVMLKGKYVDKNP